MGYACPVCDAPQRDETHLANHMALQALVHSDDHETWLDEHAPDWSSMNATGLGPVVADLAEEREFDEVFEDTVDRSHGHDHDHGHETSQFGGQGGAQPLSGDTARILDEAKSLTREMYDHEDADAEATGSDAETDSENESSTTDDDAADADTESDADEKES
ncbi:DUF5810 domain-containing protein [Haloferax sp. DFSO52]|uniref:DUF5810 domain-containing protein n=1 Tax=Haloferax sp. DFSO52 TaxID=3388505 RepID=UPI003A862546